MKIKKLLCAVIAAVSVALFTGNICAVRAEQSGEELIPDCGSTITMNVGEHIYVCFENAVVDPETGLHRELVPNYGSGAVYPSNTAERWEGDVPVYRGKVNLYAYKAGESAVYFEDAQGKSCTIYVTVKEMTTKNSVMTTVYNNVMLYGDLNRDKRINVADLVYMYKVINRDAVYVDSADMNNDGSIDVFDVVLLRRLILAV